MSAVLQLGDVVMSAVGVAPSPQRGCYVIFRVRGAGW